jgi:ethanolamine ammonia-lyase small subunit
MTDQFAAGVPTIQIDEALLANIRQRTPARVAVGRAGVSYSTSTQLGLRLDHAAAMDAVRREIDPERDFGAEFVATQQLIAVQSLAGSKEEYVLRPDLGRRLSDSARQTIAENCQADCDLQIVIGDGLSSAAVATQVPQLLPLLYAGASQRGWRVAQTILIRYCRVGIMNDLGDLLSPQVLILLVGERPGLATAESLSAYLAWRPRPGHSDADRNLISNIHSAGVPVPLAAMRILGLAELLFQSQSSGVAIKEEPQSQPGALPGTLPL